MTRKSLILGTLFCCALLVPSFALAATTGTASVTLAASANVLVDVLDPAITLTPTAVDYNNGYVDATGVSGIRVRVKSNSSTGMVLFVSDQDATPQISLPDLLLRTQTAPQGGTSMASFTAVTAANQTLWSATSPVSNWLTVTTDVRIQNLMNYPDAASAGTTSYTNTLTYSVVTQ